MKAKICPQCRENTIMDKITVKDVIIDICPGCKGVYYDRGEMKKVLSGSLDAETILSRLPYDGSDFICPACSVNMDKISARKGDLYYEMYFCRSCLATFLRNEELLKVKQKVSGSVFRQPSALRPKTVFETTFARTQTPKPETQAGAGTGTGSASTAAAGTGTARTAAGTGSSYTQTPRYTQNTAAYTPGPSAGTTYSKAASMDFTSADEKKALMHYKSINYEYAGEYESIPTSSYLFCLFSNLPLEVYNPRYYFPVVLVFIMAANALVFALTFKLIANASGASSLFATDAAKRSLDVLLSFYNTLGLVPADFISFKWLLNLFSYQFVHGSLMHFLINMYFLWVFGDNVCDIFYDRKEPIDREGSFFAFYLLTGVIGGLAHQFIYYGADLPLVGASGAVAGIMGAYLRLFPGAKFYQLIFFYPFRIPAFYYIGFWVIGQILMALSMGANSMVSWPAHLGGFLAGYISIVYFIPYAPEEINPENS